MGCVVSQSGEVQVEQVMVVQVEVEVEVHWCGRHHRHVVVCVRIAPDAYFEASHSIWKGFDWSGSFNTGSSVNFFYRLLKAF